jgi:hypothetical protein
MPTNGQVEGTHLTLPGDDELLVTVKQEWDNLFQSRANCALQQDYLTSDEDAWTFDEAMIQFSKDYKNTTEIEQPATSLIQHSKT